MTLPRRRRQSRRSGGGAHSRSSAPAGRRMREPAGGTRAGGNRDRPAARRRPGRIRPPRTRGSPTSGCPAAAMWMRIWCGRPVGIVTSARAFPFRTARMRTCETAALPPAAAAWMPPEPRMIDEADRRLDGELAPLGDAGHERPVHLLHSAGAPGRRDGPPRGRASARTTARPRSRVPADAWASPRGSARGPTWSSVWARKPPLGIDGRPRGFATARRCVVAVQDRERERHRRLLPRRPPPGQPVARDAGRRRAPRERRPGRPRPRRSARATPPTVECR